MWGIVVLLTAVIAVMAWLLFTLPAPSTTEQATSTPTTSTNTRGSDTEAPQPLSRRVVVTSPKPNTTVDKTFVVSGQAPGNWFFEASFPLQVRDIEGNVLGRTHASAQGDWMTTEQVTFTSTVHIDATYTGPATLILLRDNPSGLPENDDAVEIPIVIQ